MIGANMHNFIQTKPKMYVKKTTYLPYNYHAHDVLSSQTSFMISSPIFPSRNYVMTPGIRDEIKDVPQDGSNEVPVELLVLDGDHR